MPNMSNISRQIATGASNGFRSFITGAGHVVSWVGRTGYAAGAGWWNVYKHRFDDTAQYTMGWNVMETGDEQKNLII